VSYDVIIVGGGAVGLATALQLQKQNQKLRIVLLEKEAVVGNHQTGNNSNVITPVCITSQVV
jgi:L-2-hydroxyglutarate oxidase